MYFITYISTKITVNMAWNHLYWIPIVVLTIIMIGICVFGGVKIRNHFKMRNIRTSTPMSSIAMNQLDSTISTIGSEQGLSYWATPYSANRRSSSQNSDFSRRNSLPNQRSNVQLDQGRVDALKRLSLVANNRLDSKWNELMDLENNYRLPSGERTIARKVKLIDEFADLVTEVDIAKLNMDKYLRIHSNNK